MAEVGALRRLTSNLTGRNCGNALAADVTASFTTAAAPTTPPATLWPSTTTPSIVDSGDTSAVELGVKFTATTNGTIAGIRFYKSAANTGTHTANLWSASGQLLATAVFTNETASGWQTVTFTTPVAVTAGTTYIASYFAPNGRFAVDRDYFGANYTVGPITVPTAGGIYTYGSSSAFPESSYWNSNYWVDVLFSS